MQSLGYRPIAFHAKSSGIAIYHTNVMMGVQSTTAVLCLSVIPSNDERVKVVDTITSTGHQLIEINEDQMQSFCGNVLELHNQHDERFLVMSQSACNTFTPQQKEALQQDKQILSFAMPTIEALGGGSIRCMLAELFLPETY